MAIGIRIRDPFTNNIRLDTTDYTVSNAYQELMTVSGSGSRFVSGINENDYMATMIPAFDMGNSQQGTVAYFPRVYISGQAVIWECGSLWTTTAWFLLVVRIR